MATHSSILARRIPQTKEPGRLQSMGSERLTLSLSHFPPILFLIYLSKQASTWSPNPASVFRYIFLRPICIPGLPWWVNSKESTCNAGDSGSIPGLGRSPGEVNGNPLQNSCLENPMDRGVWWAMFHGVIKSWT